MSRGCLEAMAQRPCTCDVFAHTFTTPGKKMQFPLGRKTVTA